VDLALPEYRLTKNEYYDAECSISPDGKYVVFCSDRPSGMAIEGSSRGDTTSEVLTAPTTQPSNRSTEDRAASQSWSSTTSLSYSNAFPASQPAPSRPKNLWLMRLDQGENGGLLQLTATSGYNGGPFFSPDGNSILYRSDRVGNDLLQVYIADLPKNWRGDPAGALRNERRVTDDANVNWGPYFTPDGDRVLYATSKVSHANYEIFSRRIDGTRETRITYSPGPDVLPVVSPDGKYLMWTSRRGEDKSTQIYIAKLHFPKGS
jgi:Tol biopolymer transport system component